MYLKILINILSIIIIASLQIAFVSTLPANASYLNFALVSLVYGVIIFGFNNALIWILALGVLLDVYSFGIFGVDILSLCATLYLTDLLLNNFFTNRSLYSFVILVVAASAINFTIQQILLSTIQLFYIGDLHAFAKSKVVPLFYGILYNSFLMVLFFYFTSFLSKQFKPVFLTKNK